MKVDGKYKGETPLALERQKPGTYSITFSAEGYESKTQSVTVAAGKTATCSATLKKKQVQQSVTPQPVSQQPASTTTSSASLRTFTVNGVSFKMVQVEGGTFQMGSNGGASDEKPVHSVTLSSYSIGQTEVTQALWQAVMGSNPSNWKGDDLPVEQVSWNDCQTFITKLNQLTGQMFRLPTEAEWEYAARGGNKSKGYQYAGSNTLGDVAWYDSNSGDKTHSVATKQPNELGLYDMSGNVWEWCQDWKGNYSSSSVTNPTGPTSGSDRVNRGGGWGSGARGCRSAIRGYNTPGSRSGNLGLRLAL